MSTDGDFTLDTSTPCQFTPATLQADYSTCQQVVDSISQNIEGQLAQIVYRAYQQTNTITNTLITKLNGVYNTAQQCYSSCSDSLQTQLSQAMAYQAEQLAAMTPEGLLSITLPPGVVIGQPPVPIVPIGPAPPGQSPIIPPAQLPEIPLGPQQPVTTGPCPPCPPCIVQPGQPIIITPTTVVPPPPGGGSLPWVGWCKQPGGIIFAALLGTVAPDPTWTAVCIAASEQEALNCARSNCPQPAQQPSPSPSTYAPVPIGVFADVCDLSEFSTPAKLAALIAAMDQSQAATSFQTGTLKWEDTLRSLPFVGGTEQLGRDVTLGLLGGPFSLTDIYADIVAAYSGCAQAQFANALGTVGKIGYFNKLLGVNIPSLSVSYEYAINTLCRRLHLSPDEALTAFLANAITPEQHDTLWAIAGYCPEDVNWKVKAGRAKPIPQEIVAMRRRGINIGETYTDLMRQLGYIDSNYQELVYKLSEQLPPLTEVIDYATRTNSQPAGVDYLGLDAGIATLTQGQNGTWISGQGVEQPYAQSAWRKHWKMPGLGELFTVWHRLRTRYVGSDADRLWNEVVQSIGNHGIAPVMQSRLLEIIYSPLSIRYARLAYQVGGISDNRMRQVFTDMGLSDTDAESMFKAAKQQKIETGQASKPIVNWTRGAIDGDEATRQLEDAGFSQDDIAEILRDSSIAFERSDDAKLFLIGALNADDLTTRLTDNGVPSDAADNIVARLGERMTRHPAVEDYAAGTLDRTDALQQMIDYGVDANLSQSQLDRIDRKIKNATSANCMRSYKRQYLAGAMTNAQLTAKLTQFGLTIDRANLLTAAWQCELNASDKQVTLVMLIDWLNQGLINSQNFLNRLRLLGYDDVDAQLIYQRAAIKWDSQQQRLAQQQAKIQSQQEKAAAAAAKKLANAVNQENKAIAKANATYRTIKLKRQRQLLQVGETIYKGCSCGFTEAVEAANAIYVDLQQQADLTQDQALAVMLRVATTLGSSTIQDFATAVIDAATGLETTSIDGTVEEPVV